ncbi:hypothetical protein GHT06_010783 [Daphnia sinensis]|uniref:Fibrinogen C-terminal domain-containing protein n=1 Tax=Daphnia sinensis TaxID=1820382 RepID=A0AAD5Q1I6_9CRUS|nr:hypothetical protein GHT06_010783 [Daphnia sinensis]
MKWMMAAGGQQRLLLLLALLVVWSSMAERALAAKRSNSTGANAGTSSNRPRATATAKTTTTTTTSTTTTPSSITPDDWRDPYVYSLFEITLSAIDSKLRRVDSLERNMELMLAKLNENSARSDAILTQLKVMDGRLNKLASAPASPTAAPPLNSGRSATAANATTTTTTATSGSDREYSLEPRILALDEKVSQIGSKLNVLTYQLDSNSLLWAGLANYNETGRAGTASQDDYVSSSSEQARAYITVPQIRGDKLIDRRGSDWSAANGAEEAESIRTTMASMDRHLKILIELFSEQMDKMMGAVADVRSAVVTSHHDPSSASSLLLTAAENPVLLASGRPPSTGVGSTVSTAKLDQLYQKMAPLLDVSDKMDQVWNVLIEAKNSVDSLVPTSEALLWQTQRQERALTDIHAEVSIKTKQIIDNLNALQLARESQTPLPGVSSSTTSTSTSTTSSTSSRSTAAVAAGAPSNLTKRSKSDAHDAGIIIANKPQESQQVSVTFKQTSDIPTSRGVVGGSQSVIRAQELSPGPVVAAVLAAAKSSTTTSTTSTTSTTTTTPLPHLLPPPPEVVPIPSDIMDSEFLHDDPIVVLTANQTSAGPSSNGGSAKSGDNKKTLSLQPSTAAVIAAAATANTSTTTSRSVLLQHIVPAGPTERSRIPNNSNVIFPSVKNKPGFTNTTFFYDYTTPQNIRGYSCAELKEQGLTKSGIYYLLIRGTSFWYIKVYCDMEAANGGWTVIQRRDDYGGDNRENFNRDWDDYKSGFGDPDHEFWLGNENIYMLTNAEDYSLRVELEDFEGNKRYAEYSSFKLYSEREQYKLEIGGYTGNAGDSLNDPWYGSNLSPFSTYNRDNDRSSLNCASMLKGGWWWKSCGRGLNGIYLTDPQDLTARQGIVWFRWRGWDYTLKRATMMIRPRHYGKEPSINNPQEKTASA